jgi:hypothetical protein
VNAHAGGVRSSTRRSDWNKGDGLMKVLGGLGILLVAGAAMAGAQEGDNGKKNRDFETSFKKLDANMDGKLNRDEFLKMADRAKEKNQARQKLGEAYDKLDPQRKGLARDVFKRYLDERKK